PGKPNFAGLGELTAPELATLYPQRHPVTDAQFALARAAWAAFTAPEPSGIVCLLDGDTSTLPFLGAALIRHLEQFPAPGSGLSRTDRQIVEVVASGAHSPGAAFRATQALESARFMGDVTFFDHMAGLVQARHPLLTTGDTPLVPVLEWQEFVKVPFDVTAQ